MIMIPRRWVYEYPGERADYARWAASDAATDHSVVCEWERRIADFVGMPHAVAVNSGRRGMTLVLRHLGLASGDEVIVPAYTLGELIPLIEGLGAKAIPADIDPHSLNMDPAAVARRISPRTKAILTLHAFGNPCAIDEIVQVGDEHGIPVIEDCAHSLGATCKGRQTGSFGYAGFFSFETTKPVNTYGGGMVVSRDEDLIEHIRNDMANDPVDLSSADQKLSAVRTEKRLFKTGLGFPFLFLLATPSCKNVMNRLYRTFGQHAVRAALRYSPVQAKLGLEKFATLGQRIAFRNERAKQFRALLDPSIRIQQIAPESETTWYFFVAILPAGAGPIRRNLLLRGIDAGAGEEIADDCAALLGFEDCPVVKEVFSRTIALPMYDDIPAACVERTAKALNALVK